MLSVRIDERLAPHITNRLDPIDRRWVTGIVGDRPSQYAKTPLLWNAAYRDLGWDAVSVPWDVEAAQLAGFVQAIRASEQVLGFSVTQPFKVAILSLLDELDPLAAPIGAVNTVVRTADARLVGYNTDGQGAIDALTLPLQGSAAPFLAGLAGLNVLILGAGGAARAVAFFIANQMARRGALRIVNRDRSKASALAVALQASTRVSEGAGESALPQWITEADLIVNATVKGQAGWRSAGDDRMFSLEPYSALAPCDPPATDRSANLDGSAWFARASSDIEKNARAAHDALVRMKPRASCFDLVYAPLETRFLAQAKLTGHPTMNGKWMNIAQAADGFVRKVCAPVLAAQRLDPHAMYGRVFELMARVW